MARPERIRERRADRQGAQEVALRQNVDRDGRDLSALTRIACPASDMATLPLREARTDATPLIGADEAQMSVAPTLSTLGTTVALAPASSSQLVVDRRAVAKHQGAALM